MGAHAVRHLSTSPHLWDPLHAGRVAPDGAPGRGRRQGRGLEGAAGDGAEAALGGALAVLPQLTDTAEPPEGRMRTSGGTKS